jgi:hypothetical protein
MDALAPSGGLILSRSRQVELLAIHMISSHIHSEYLRWTNGGHCGF